MEVGFEPDQQAAEARYVVDLCRAKTNPTLAAVIGGQPAAAGFHDYIRRFNESGFVRGVRQVLHGDETPAGTCLKADFVKGIEFLGQQRLSFDLCMRPAELSDALKLCQLCPDTQFILDHCGNADPKAFMKNPPADQPPEHEADPWKRDVAALAKRPNVVCKISGIVARATPDWTPEQLAPIVNHCLDAFGPDRVVFGGDWPICLARSTFIKWVESLRQIIASRPAADQQKLWADNARRIYHLER